MTKIELGTYPRKRRNDPEVEAAHREKLEAAQAAKGKKKKPAKPKAEPKPDPKKEGGE